VKVSVDVSDGPAPHTAGGPCGQPGNVAGFWVEAACQWSASEQAMHGPGRDGGEVVTAQQCTTTLHPSVIMALHVATVQRHSLAATRPGRGLQLLLATGHMSFCCIEITVKAVAEDVAKRVANHSLPAGSCNTCAKLHFVLPVMPLC